MDLKNKYAKIHRIHQVVLKKREENRKKAHNCLAYEKPS